MLELPRIRACRVGLPQQRTSESKACRVTGPDCQRCEHCSTRAQRWRQDEDTHRLTASAGDEGKTDACAAHSIAGPESGDAASHHSALDATAGDSDEFACPAAASAATTGT